MIQNYIGGRWLDSSSKERLPVHNPSNGEILAQCPAGTLGDVNQAVMSAEKAFAAWAATPAQERVQCFFRLKTLMEAHAENLARQITLENGKTLIEARGSVRRAIQMVETACGIPTLMMGDFFEDIARDIDCSAFRKPMGVFAAICPFNFPAMVPFWFWPFAVACGNTYVIKPSERVPLTQMEIFKLIDQAGFPPGVVNMVHGDKEVANALCEHPQIQGISFVGSTPVAKHVYRTVTHAGKRAQCLGGAKNFMVMMPDAALDPSVQTALESILGCAGERCLAGSVILSVGEETARAVEKKITALASQIKIGDGLDPKTTMGPVISLQAKERIIGLIQSAEKEGAKILLDGRQGVDKMPGYFLKPTVITQVTAKMRVAVEEIFGPVICLAETKSLDSAIEWINSSPFANTTTLFTQSGGAARQFCSQVDPTMIGINIGVPAPMAFFSFGGAKDSFFGDIKAHGSQCIDFFTHKRTVISRWHHQSSIWKA